MPALSTLVSVTLLSLLLGGGVTATAPSGASAPTVAVAPPPVPDGFVLRPFFNNGVKTWSAGTAFVVDFQGQPLIVTALNLLGPNGGMETQIEAKQLPEQLKSVEVRDAFNGRGAGRTTATLLIPEAHVMKDDAAGDVAAFKIPRPPTLSIAGGTTTPIIPGKLASSAPKKGDTLFLATALASGKQESRVFSAKVLQADDKWLFYRFDDSALDLTGTPGAPLLNDKGEIVGMQLGGGKNDEGLIGAACPLPALQARLQSGLTNTAN